MNITIVSKTNPTGYIRGLARWDFSASTRRCLVSTAVENNATFMHTATTDSVNRLCSTVSISAPAEAAEAAAAEETAEAVL